MILVNLVFKDWKWPIIEIIIKSFSCVIEALGRSACLSHLYGYSIREMGDLKSLVSAAQRIVMSIDASDEAEAHKLAQIAKDSDAGYIKMGLELSSATSWRWCSQLAEEFDLEWIADAKLSDIPNTVAATVRNFKKLDLPPFGITVHIAGGSEAIRLAQEIAGTTKILGVTILTSLSDEETKKIYGVAAAQKVLDLAKMAAEAGLAGIVCSAQEIRAIRDDNDTKDLFLMVPGTRSLGTAHGDQARVTTPTEAIKAGADLLVIGRQVTQSDNPAQAFNNLLTEIEGALNNNGDL